MPQPTVLEGPDELTAEWVTAALREAGTLSGGGSVSDISWEPIGDGYAGIVVRIHLGSGAAAVGAPATVIGKFSASHPPMRQLLGSLGFYGREVGFYRDIAGADGRGAGMPVPGCFYAVLSDLRQRSSATVALTSDVERIASDVPTL